ncbi:MAG: ribbon-helix-helix protein, CopG family [Proteobacteria bacterium]|nr:ribbon-helix-helix protein, CopG family [Pseudomonadota bacterium]
MKVLPLRMEAEIVARVDEARERLGLKTRMDLFRKSLADYLTAAGEHEVAQLFTERA